MAAVLRLFAALMTGVLLLAILLVPSAAQMIPRDRLAPNARCVGALNGTAACIECSVVITVNAEQGTSCQEGDLNGRSCSDLETVVEGIATGRVPRARGECVLVRIVARPQGEAHVVQARENRVLEHSVVFRGVNVDEV